MQPNLSRKLLAGSRQRTRSYGSVGIYLGLSRFAKGRAWIIVLHALNIHTIRRTSPLERELTTRYLCLNQLVVFVRDRFQPHRGALASARIDG